MKFLFILFGILFFNKTFATTYTFTNTSWNNISWTDPSYWDNYPGTTVNSGDNISINGLCFIGTNVQVYGSVTVVRKYPPQTQSTLWINAGTILSIKNGGILINDAAFYCDLNGTTGKIVVEQGGVFTNYNSVVGNITINSGGVFNFSSGGYGMMGHTYAGNLTNTGARIDISWPTSNIIGNFNNGIKPLHFNYSSDVNNDFFVGSLNVSGTATLSGTFNFYNTGPSLPPLNAQYTVMQAASITGTFINSSVNIGSGKYANIYYNATSVYIRIEGTVLPVEILHFEAKPKENANILTWQTADETHNKGFSIERSLDGKTFENIGFAKSIGSHANYEFQDDTPLSISYYRLRQTDVDGKETLSKVVSIIREGADEITLFPNPTNGKLNVKTIQFQINQVRIFNNLGQVMINKALINNELDISELPNGIYQVEFLTDNKRVQKRIIKN